MPSDHHRPQYASAGEALTHGSLAGWPFTRHTKPGWRWAYVRLTPTEATIASSYYTVPRCPDDEKAPIPIGTACEGEELLVLDAELNPTRPG